MRKLNFWNTELGKCLNKGSKKYIFTKKNSLNTQIFYNNNSVVSS